MREKLISARKQKGLTQQEIAEMIGVSRTTYTGYEKGNYSPSLEKAVKIKEVLKYKNDDIFLNTNVSKTNKTEENKN